MVLSFVFLFGAASGATLTVTKIADTNDNVCDSDCSLREAIFAAAASGDTVEFASPLFDSTQTIVLSGELYVNKTLMINGKGASLTKISGNNATRVFNADGNLTLNNLTITGGRVSGGANGTGIYNNSGKTLVINDCVIFDNSVVNSGSWSNGGGIYNAGTTTISRTTISANGTTATSGNVAGGGGIYSSGRLVIENSTLSGNAAAGGTNNYGGAIWNYNGILTLINSTVSGNAVAATGFGGGIANYFAILEIYNTTIARNSASLNGGGVFNQQSTLFAINSIISGNSAPNNPNLLGTFNLNTNNFVNGDARLAPLGNYGGATQTHALLSDSPALNAGNNCVTPVNGCGRLYTTFTTDRRGAGFPRLVGAVVDIGAFEGSIPYVSNSDNNGAGSLRQAVSNAAAGDTIFFDPTFFASPRTIALTGGEIVISKNLTINGTGANLLTIDAAHANRIFNIQVNNSLTVSGVRMIRGSTGGNGGCVYVGGVFNLINSEVSNCSANYGGGIYNASTGTINLVRSNINGGQATSGSGGIYNAGTLNFTDSTLSGNTAQFGGGLINDGFSNIVNATISGNRTTTDKGAGIYNSFGRITHLLNTTITNNQANTTAGAGIWNENFGNPTITVRARNTIIAGNISGAGNPVDYVGDLVNLGNNLINNANPGLAPLGNYGGATPTHALLPNAPALNAGDNCALTENTCGIAHSALIGDQRSSTPRRIGANIDIGAFERNITFDQTTLPNGSQNASYSQQLSAVRLTNFSEIVSENQLAPFTYSIIDGALPPDLSLDANTGIISGAPTAQGTYNFTVKATDTDAMAGAMQYTIQIFAPTAAFVSIGGRILTANGSGIRNVIVTLTDSNGTTRSSRSATFGYYQFDDVEVGETYIISVASKRYFFNQQSQILTVNKELRNINFIAQERVCKTILIPFTIRNCALVSSVGVSRCVIHDKQLTQLLTQTATDSNAQFLGRNGISR